MTNSKTTEEEVVKLVGEMKKHFTFPSRTMLDIKSYENTHTQIIMNKYCRQVENFECGFELLVDLVIEANFVDKTNWPPHRTTQLLLLKNSLFPLYSSSDLYLKGFYDDSVILLRTTYEAFISILYLSYFPEDPYGVFVKKPKKGQRQFNLTNFIEHTLSVDWAFIYSITSSYSHSYTHRVLSEANDLSQNGQKKLIRFELCFDENKASIPMNITIFLLWVQIKFANMLFFICQNHVLVPEYKIKIEASEKAFGAIISSSKNKWATIYEDVNRIYDEVLKKEAF